VPSSAPVSPFIFIKLFIQNEVVEHLLLLNGVFSNNRLDSVPDAVLSQNIAERNEGN
jgi:hypothetical protein